MGKHSNTIEINGQRYNATTGEAITGGTGHKPSHNRRQIDGVSAKPSHGHKLPTATKTLTPKLKATMPTAVKKPVMDIARSPASHATRHQPQVATTLMRTAVKKPQPSLKRHVKAIQPMDMPARSVHPVANLQAVRAQHTNAAEHSGLIRHFNPVVSSEFQPSTIIQRQPQPVSQPISPTATPVASKTDLLIQKALQNATSHTEVPVTPKQRHFSKAARITTGALIALALVGIAGYQNLGNLKLHFAANKAGFAASLPAYRPSGYRLSTVTAIGGAVGINFHSNSDQRAYTVTEKTSDWNSAMLLSTFVTPTAGNDYQTISAAGRTIYLYGKNNATWVNGGIWYQVVSQGSLSNQQLIDLATSL